MQRKVYILENLDCANCAAKIERKLSKLPELSDVSVTFATKQLRFAAEDPEAVLPKIRETIQSMEPDVEVVERTRGKRKTAEHHHEHHYDEHGVCSCGHHHHHDHDADEVFTSWGKETAHKYSREDLDKALHALDEGAYGMILRAKGIVDGGDTWYEFDMVPGEHEIRPCGPDVTGKLCVIGSQLKEHEIAELFHV